MKILSIALLLASVASVRSASTLNLVFTYGVTMADPTGTAGTLEGPDNVELVVDGKFAPFERQVKVTDASGWKEYTVSLAVMQLAMRLI